MPPSRRTLLTTTGALTTTVLTGCLSKNTDENTTPTPRSPSPVVQSIAFARPQITNENVTEQTVDDSRVRDYTITTTNNGDTAEIGAILYNTTNADSQQNNASISDSSTDTPSSDVSVPDSGTVTTTQTKVIDANTTATLNIRVPRENAPKDYRIITYPREFRATITNTSAPGKIRTAITTPTTGDIDTVIRKFDTNETTAVTLTNTTIHSAADIEVLSTAVTK